MVGPVEVGTAVGCAAVVGWNVYREYRERSRSKKYDLKENPERCKDHEMRLRAIEQAGAATSTALAVLTVEVHGIGKRMDNIADLFNRTGGDAL